MNKNILRLQHRGCVKRHLVALLFSLSSINAKGITPFMNAKYELAYLYNVYISFSFVEYKRWSFIN